MADPNDTRRLLAEAVQALGHTKWALDASMMREVKLLRALQDILMFEPAPGDGEPCRQIAAYAQARARRGLQYH